MSWTRRAARSTAVLLCLVALPGCGAQKTTAADELREALARTAAQPHGFTYLEHTADREITVSGQVEDDFRYAAELKVDGARTYGEVVRDDAIAARAYGPLALTLLARTSSVEAATTGGVGAPSPGPSATAGAAPTTPRVGSAGLAGRAALARGGWVLDKLGAPSLLPSAQNKHVVGDDPIYDALTTLHYVDAVSRQAHAVVTFDEDDLSYRPKEDPFAKPDRSAGEVRYDLVRPFLSRVKGGDGQAGPSMASFRKLAVFVRRGVVVRVVEDIDVGSLAKDVANLYDFTLPRGASRDQQVAAVVEQLNAERAKRGDEPLRVRTMSLTLDHVGAPAHVVLPATSAVATLASLRNRGSATGAIPTHKPEPTGSSVPTPVIAATKP